MKRIDGLLIKLAIIHLVFLLISQWVLSHNSWKRNVNKSIYYEGVIKGTNPSAMETIDR